MPDRLRTALLAALGCLAFAAPPAAAVDAPAVERAARDEGLAAPVAGALAASALDGVRVRRTLGAPGPAPLGATRLGGAPDLDPHTPWPRCRRRPMAFLGQVRAAELPRGSPLPADGLLSLFAQVREDRLWAGDCGAVLWTPEGSPMVRRAAPRLRPRVVLRTAVVRLVLDASVPAAAPDGRLGAPLAALRLGPTDRARLAALRDDGIDAPAHRLLGFPDTGGEDPRTTCAASDGGAPGDWRLVAQIDRDRALGLGLADRGRLFLLVRDGRLDRVCSVLDAARDA